MRLLTSSPTKPDDRAEIGSTTGTAGNTVTCNEPAAPTHGETTKPDGHHYLLAMTSRFTPRHIIWMVVLVLCGLAAFGFVMIIRPTNVSKMPPERIFRWLVCDPMPSSIANIKARGSLSLTGHLVEMDCDIAPSDFSLLLKRGNFIPVEEGSVQEDWFKQQRTSIPTPEFYERRGGDFDKLRTVFLLTSTNHERLFIQYFRP